MQKKFPLYAENFPVWASQANGMLQFGIWSGLTDMGLGVNLQHYNPLIDAEVKNSFVKQNRSFRFDKHPNLCL